MSNFWGAVQGGRVIDIEHRVGAVVASCGTSGAVGACTGIHRIDRYRDAVGIGGGDRARDNGYIFGGNQACDRIGSRQEEGEDIVKAGADPTGVLFGAEDVVETERVCIGQKVEVEGSAVAYPVGLDKPESGLEPLAGGQCRQVVLRRLVQPECPVDRVERRSEHEHAEDEQGDAGTGRAVVQHDD